MSNSLITKHRAIICTIGICRIFTSSTPPSGLLLLTTTSSSWISNIFDSTSSIAQSPKIFPKNLGKTNLHENNPQTAILLQKVQILFHISHRLLSAIICSYVASIKVFLFDKRCHILILIKKDIFFPRAQTISHYQS